MEEQDKPSTLVILAASMSSSGAATLGWAIADATGPNVPINWIILLVLSLIGAVDILGRWSRNGS
jgi:hypothetical protein